MTEDELFRRINHALCDANYGRDVRRAACLAIDLCALGASLFDRSQLEAVEFAKGYWAGKSTKAERLSLLEALWTRDREIWEQAPLSAEACRSRLVVWTLTDNTGLDDYAGEFMADLALRAGLTPEQIAHAFERNVPEMRGGVDGEQLPPGVADGQGNG